MIGSVCTVEVNYRKFGLLPICGDDVMFPKDLLQMVGMDSPNVFNTKVINDESENNWAPFVVTDPGGFGIFIVTGFVKVFEENTIRQFFSLWQAVASLENF